MSTVLSAIRRLQYTPLPYLILAALVAGLVFFLFRGSEALPAPRNHARSELPQTVIGARGIYTRDPNDSKRYVPVR